MQYYRRGRKYGDLWPALSQSYVWISRLNVDSLLGRSRLPQQLQQSQYCHSDCFLYKLHSQLEKNCRRPLDGSNERTSVDFDPD